MAFEQGQSVIDCQVIVAGRNGSVEVAETGHYQAFTDVRGKIP